jgi:56kDa selenium binding protein (SBP56)
MGDEAGEPKGGFIVVDQDFKVKGAWSEDHSPFGCVPRRASPLVISNSRCD